MSFVVCVSLVIGKQHQDAFLGLVRENARLSLDNEQDCLRFDVCAAADNPHAILLYEIYTSPASFQAHLATDHFLKFDAEVAHMVEDKQINTFQLVS